MRLSCILSIDYDIVQVYYNEDIKLFSENLFNIVLKLTDAIEKSKNIT